ncbi:unnamed protein product [Timema podura]|uniref:Uncharacterized protein n=1 Tax=Timema podura TaxID=61482 RepID=A0ABN7NS45_TIMPD|nr:unnamed protein product [Timema podura]
MLNKARSYLPVLLVVVLLFSQHAHGRPYRRKRTSDQRLAEIQTYLALSKMKGEIKNVPVAFGIVDLNHIGRRRRSLKRSLKDLMNSSRQESIADDVLTNDPNENLNDLLTRLDQDNRAEWQYDWDIYPSLLNCPHEAEFGPILDPLLRRNILEAPKIKPGTSGSVARNYEH